MPNLLREAWTNFIQAADYDDHMRAVGQAGANAELIKELLTQLPPPKGSGVLVAGAGTGQMFDYLDYQVLRPYGVLFCDINPRFLEVLRGRLKETLGFNFQTQIDDLERSTLTQQFDTVIAVLVLEHIDWKTGVSTLTRLAARQVFVVLQENPPSSM